MLTFEQQYQIVNASAENILGQMKIDNTQLRGDEVSFDLMIGASSHRFIGKVTGDKIEGTAVAPGSKQPIAWRANKLAAQK